VNLTIAGCLEAEGCEALEDCLFDGTAISDDVFSEVETCAVG